MIDYEWPADWPLQAIEMIESRGDEIVTLRSRIEELELERERITDKMIDRAWAFRGIHGLLRREEYVPAADLGIVACRECGGSGEKVTTGFDSRLQADTDAEYECPACYRNGKSHGWVRRGR